MHTPVAQVLKCDVKEKENGWDWATFQRLRTVVSRAR